VTAGTSIAGSVLGGPLLESSVPPASPSLEQARCSLAALLPPGACAAESRTDAWTDTRPENPPALLYPGERAQIGNAVKSRLREFATSRALARQALSRLGLRPAPILRGSRGEPLWPPGVVGSITHCAGYRAAAVARCTHLRALGVDAEIGEPLPRDAVSSILVAEEIAWLARAPGPHPWDRVLFSAKESVYKAWFPFTHRWLDFFAVAVTVNAAEATFRVRALGNLPEELARLLSQLSGRFLIADGIILTAVFLPLAS
jgi:4'-phosphopantetheinyl transferase EntD